MPKLKTHKGASKRFRKTATGKIKRNHSFARHILTSKSRARKRRLTQRTLVDRADLAAVRSMLPYS
jgi:large subunit ribosomal protein L35